MRGANPGNVWEFSHIHYCQANRQNHPTQKPEALFERMILASTDENDLVLDPFCGSGTSLRVCQQLNRRGIGIEINEDYVNMTMERLSRPFCGFDSIDERMGRVPNDLNDTEIRDEYIRNHIEWFLRNHPDKSGIFLENVRKKYSKKMVQLSVYNEPEGW
jgi:site-specific DNA-methyltransferase (adenine-specific)